MYIRRSSQVSIDQTFRNIHCLCSSVMDWQSRDLTRWQKFELQGGPIAFSVISLPPLLLYGFPLRRFSLHTFCFHVSRLRRLCRFRLAIWKGTQYLLKYRWHVCNYDGYQCTKTITMFYVARNKFFHLSQFMDCTVVLVTIQDQTTNKFSGPSVILKWMIRDFLIECLNLLLT